MTATVDNAVADLQRTVGELRRLLDERTAERDEYRAERDEALDQQTATAEVLQVINSSPGDLAPVFDAMLAKALDLCEVTFGALITVEGGVGQIAALRNVPSAVVEVLTNELSHLGPDTAIGRAVVDRSVIHIADVAATEFYRKGVRLAVAALDLGGIRSIAFVPLIKDAAAIGVFTVFRQEVRPFTDKQIALLENFAAQAVIAMENARLLTETREALDQQTATAEVLRVINSSPGDLAPVFDAILEKAHSLCGAVQGGLITYDGEHFRAVATHAIPESFAELLRQPFPSVPGSPQDRMLRGEQLIHIPDAAAVASAHPIARASLAAGIRTLLMVPLRKDEALLGYITAHRQEVRPFTDKEIALLQNFAAQAVIAMENARLITETREALEQQTATSEVLQVINSSPGDLVPVFEAMLDKAMRLCEASFGAFMSFDGKLFHRAAHRGLPTELVEEDEPLPPLSGGAFARIISGEASVHVNDLADTEFYRSGNRGFVRLVDRGGARTAIWMALRKDDALLGAAVIYRQEVRPFTDKQIALLQNFAAQAVIAIENARLITETREALDQQTATAEVLQVINSSPGDLAPVFDAMLEKAMTLCSVAHGSMQVYDGKKFTELCTCQTAR